MRAFRCLRSLCHMAGSPRSSDSQGPRSAWTYGDNHWIIAVQLARVELRSSTGHQLDHVERVIPLDALPCAALLGAGWEPPFRPRAEIHGERIAVLDQDPHARDRVPVEDLQPAGDKPTSPPTSVVRHEEVELALAKRSKLAFPRVHRHLAIVGTEGNPEADDRRLLLPMQHWRRERPLLPRWGKRATAE